jgi:hypothetical protein
MLSTHSIRALYGPALAEGEGVGTAYEYFAKRLLLGRWLGGWRPQRILIAGLPEKYGSSLDFLLLAADLEAEVTVFDDRQSALARLGEALEVATDLSGNTQLSFARPNCRLISDLGEVAKSSERWDLLLSSEVVQRLPGSIRGRYLGEAVEAAGRVALFMPNADNPAHTKLSGLRGLGLDELRGLVAAAGDGKVKWQSGYIDMPPFPPGMIRSEAQRQQASTGMAEGMAMWGLGYYARLERFFPASLRRRNAHIVYLLGG